MFYTKKEQLDNLNQNANIKGKWWLVQLLVNMLKDMIQ